MNDLLVSIYVLYDQKIGHKIALQGHKYISTKSEANG